MSVKVFLEKRWCEVTDIRTTMVEFVVFRKIALKNFKSIFLKCLRVDGRVGRIFFHTFLRANTDIYFYAYSFKGFFEIVSGSSI